MAQYSSNKIDSNGKIFHKFGDSRPATRGRIKSLGGGDRPPRAATAEVFDEILMYLTPLC